MKLRRTAVAASLFACTVLQGSALAQPAHAGKGAAKPAGAPASPAPTPAAQGGEDQGKKDAAREHFQKGLTLFDEEAWDAALVEFMTSRSTYPTRSATKNAALCLHKLHRFGEALAMFEELLAFPNLPAEDRQLAEREVKTLRALVGTITLAASEAGASVTLDGRDQGAAPLAGPIRVDAGTHTLRVYKDGFEPFEARLQVLGGQAQEVRATLRPLMQAGRLKVTEANGRVLDVVVDNVVVGKTPWDGALAPGDHAVVLRGAGALGTQPASAPVKLNQVTPIMLAAEELTAEVRVTPTPAGATIAVDGVTVGRGTWEGKLRKGRHTIESAQEGFLPFARVVTLEDDNREVIAAELLRDPSSPLWNQSRPRVVLELDAAFAVAPKLGGDVAGCASPCRTRPALGFAALGRGVYQFRSGFGIGVEAGYLLLKTSVDDRATTLTPTGFRNPGTAHDALTLGGLIAGGNAAMRLGSKAPLTLRLGAGVLLGSVSDQRSGDFATQARASKPSHAYSVADVGESPAARYFYLTPEVRVALPIGDHVELSAGVQAMVLIALSQPKWVGDQKQVLAGGDGSGTFPDETLTGKTIVVIAPGLGARYAF